MSITYPAELLWSFSKWKSYISRCSIKAIEKKIAYYNQWIDRAEASEATVLMNKISARLAYLETLLPKLKTTELLKGTSNGME